MIIVVAILLVFEMFLLKPMYLNNKIKSVRDTADLVLEQLNNDDLTNESLEEVIFNAQMQSESCIRVISDASNPFSNEFDNKCFIYRMPPEEFDLIIENSEKDDDGEYIEIRDEKMKGMQERGMQTIIYSKRVNSADIDYIMVQTNITPIDATIKTLNYQLLYIGILLLISVIVLTILLSKRIAKPLVSINNAAKSLSHGDYEVPQDSNNFIEAEELNTTLQQAAVDIQKADKAKRDLIANVSHDLRTPLTMITGYGEMMKDLPEENNEENLNVVINESKRLSTLVNDLLDLSKFQDETIELNKQVFDLTELINSELKKYEVYVIRDGFKIEALLGQQAFINADKGRVQQVFNNLMQNAVHYTLEDKHIIVKEIITDDSVQVQIQDFGEGIKEEDLVHIWDRYFKVDKKHERHTHEGSGIGLSIVKKILDLHEAKYGVNSKYKEGSTFWFEFPIVKQ